MTDLTTLLRDLSEKATEAAKDWPRVDGGVQTYLRACPPALIQALVEVALAAEVARQNDGTYFSATLVKLFAALRRLEAVAQHLSTPRT